MPTRIHSRGIDFIRGSLYLGLMDPIIKTHLTLKVTDLDAAVKFYTEVLNLKLLQRYGEHYAEIEAANITLGLHPSGPETVYSDNISVGLGVNALDETVKELEAKGIAFTLETGGWMRLAHFKDPDGNALYLAEV